MSRKITRHKGGTNEIKVPLDSVKIPDLWHVAQKVLDLEDKRAILETWHLAHDLLRELREKDS